MKRKLRYTVTFETPESAPPLTLTGEISASTTQAGARLAVKDAMSRAPGKRWDSLLVLLERSTGAGEGSDHA